MTDKNDKLVEEETNKSTKSPEAIRQDKVSLRRKESGLIAKRLQFTSTDLSRLNAIATDVLGYEISEGEKLGLEDLSAVISYCVAVTTSEHNLLKVSKPSSEEKLYRRKIKNIIRFRLKQEKNHNDKMTRVAKFLDSNNYPIPSLSPSMVENLPLSELESDTWSKLKVQALLGKLTK
ncbi:hypothetical protein [Vibrio antiquarius]|uniref:hypothetical protein n=1 Tax=Vibrio antiquarius (strain Ex25) TaxID=150340 RepID=UPI002659619D|nr:hypothetical protein [Vibrio antiquarius]MCR9367428.1 hypothetical protein [Vibrio antiquarius]